MGAAAAMSSYLLLSAAAAAGASPAALAVTAAVKLGVADALAGLSARAPTGRGRAVRLRLLAPPSPAECVAAVVGLAGPALLAIALWREAVAGGGGSAAAAAARTAAWVAAAAWVAEDVVRVAVARTLG
jgi:hypothetical protein